MVGQDTRNKDIVYFPHTLKPQQQQSNDFILVLEDDVQLTANRHGPAHRQL